jgi:uncharacterized protein YfiM (DUF2279 family)
MLASLAPAAEILGVDSGQLDKQAHFATGFALSASTTTIINAYGSDWPWWMKAAVPVLVTSVAATGKEIWDSHHRGHTPDWRDAAATTAGGCAAVICLSWTW